MTWQDNLIKFGIDYGFQIFGAAVIFVVGFLIARTLGRLTNRWLSKHDLEPPIRMLLVRVVWSLVMMFTLIGDAKPGA